MEFFAEERIGEGSVLACAINALKNSHHRRGGIYPAPL